MCFICSNNIINIVSHENQVYQNSYLIFIFLQQLTLTLTIPPAILNKMGGHNNYK